jgi:hypothetical protein
MKMKIPMWGGFVDGKIDRGNIDDHWGGQNERPAPAIFTSCKEARRQYQDVRPVTIEYLSE